MKDARGKIYDCFCFYVLSINLNLSIKIGDIVNKNKCLLRIPDG